MQKQWGGEGGLRVRGRGGEGEGQRRGGVEPARQPENVTLLVKSETKGNQKQLFTWCLVTKM